MKYLMSILMILTVSTLAQAASLWGNEGIKSVEYVYDFSVDGGASGSTVDFSHGKSLPSGAIVLDVYYNVVTAFTSGGSAVVALGDAADTGATVSATAYNNAAYALANLAKDSAGQPKICSATTCAPRIAITGAALTAGKIKVNYVYIQPSGK